MRRRTGSLRFLGLILSVSIFLYAAPGLTEPCPSCPGGCVPRGMVESLRVEADAIVDSCPAECVSVSRVKSFLDTPRCTTAATTQDDARPAPATEETGVTPPTDPPAGSAPLADSGTSEALLQDTIITANPYYANTRHRLVTMPTASGLEKGRTAITGYGFGLWEFQHGVTKEVQVGIMTLLPVLVTALAPTVRVHGQINENFYLSGGVFGSWFHSYNSDYHVLFGGGSIEGTFRSGRHTFNLGLVAMSGGSGDKDWGGYYRTVWDAWDAVLLLPHLGYRLELAEIWSFQLEFMPLLWISTREQEYTRTENFTALIFYGFRVHGSLLYGDFGFCIPASAWFGDWLWSYAPLGLPYFSLGFYF